MDKSATLAATYSDLKALTAEASVIHDKIEYVEKHGKLPETTKGNSSTSEMSYAEIKDGIRKLNDFISKTKKKLKPSAKPASEAKKNEWTVRLNEAELQREELKRRKSEIENAGK